MVPPFRYFFLVRGWWSRARSRISAVCLHSARTESLLAEWDKVTGQFVNSGIIIGTHSLVDAPSPNPYLYLCVERHPPANSIILKDFDDDGRSIFGEVEDAEPVGITVSYDQI